MKRNTIVIVGLCAFLSLLLFTLSFILGLLNVNVGLIRTIAYGLSLVVILVTAHSYVSKLKGEFWKIIFYIIAVLAVIDFFYPYFI